MNIKSIAKFLTAAFGGLIPWKRRDLRPETIKSNYPAGYGFTPRKKANSKNIRGKGRGCFGLVRNGRKLARSCRSRMQKP